MARTAKATIKSKDRRKEAAADRRRFGGVSVDRPSVPLVNRGLVVKRPGMDDLNLDDLANCPAPEDALLLLSRDACEAMQAVPESARLEVCKTIVALGDVVARTHAPNIAAIKLSLRADGGIEATAEGNGRVFYKRSDTGIIAGFSGAICAVARAEAKQRSGKAHVDALENWGNALHELGAHLNELATSARNIAEEIVQEVAEGLEKPAADKYEPPLSCRKIGNPGPVAFVCVLERGHRGPCSGHARPRGDFVPTTPQAGQIADDKGETA